MLPFMYVAARVHTKQDSLHECVKFVYLQPKLQSQDFQSREIARIIQVGFPLQSVSDSNHIVSLSLLLFKMNGVPDDNRHTLVTSLGE